MTDEQKQKYKDYYRENKTNEQKKNERLSKRMQKKYNH